MIKEDKGKRKEKYTNDETGWGKKGIKQKRNKKTIRGKEREEGKAKHRNRIKEKNKKEIRKRYEEKNAEKEKQITEIEKGKK